MGAIALTTLDEVETTILHLGSAWMTHTYSNKVSRAFTLPNKRRMVDHCGLLLTTKNDWKRMELMVRV